MNTTIVTAKNTVITFSSKPRPERGERTGPAWEKIMEIMGDGEWHLWRDIVATVQPPSGLKVKTVSNLLHAAVGAGHLQRRGKYSPDPARDTRSVKLTTEGAS